MLWKLNQLWVSKNRRLVWVLTSSFLAAGVMTLAWPDLPTATAFWQVQAVDTVKYSRDVSREKLGDPAFDEIIERQVAAIASTGATHVAIGTPYDEEFWPMLERWEAAARRHRLNVWYRGNWSGWEGWFGYPAIDRAEHIRATEALILNHAKWFRDGDIFTACPECENGGPGDPRRTGDAAGHRAFLIAEYEATRRAFEAIGRNVASNFNSMNGDVARLIMDKETTAALGGVVTVDHYVATPEKLAGDLLALHEASGGQIVLGELGVPIPDIHGSFSAREQSQWLAAALQELALAPHVLGVNYWLAVGGSTQLWDSAGEARPAVAVLTDYFTPEIIGGVVEDDTGQGLGKVAVSDGLRRTKTNSRGEWQLPYVPHEIAQLTFAAAGFEQKTAGVSLPREDLAVTLISSEKRWREKMLQLVRDYFAGLMGTPVNGGDNTQGGE